MASVEDGIATPRSPVSVSIRLRGHSLIQDKPASSGGSDEGPMASELLLAGLLACQNSTFYKIAAKRKVAVSIRSIRGELHFDDASDIDGIQVKFDLAAAPDVGDGALETLLRLTDKACTISQVLKVPVVATYTRTAVPAATANSR